MDLAGEDLIFRQMVVVLAFRTWGMLEFLQTVEDLDGMYKSSPHRGRISPRVYQEELIRIFQETRPLIPVGNP